MKMNQKKQKKMYPKKQSKWVWVIRLWVIACILIFFTAAYSYWNGDLDRWTQPATPGVIKSFCSNTEAHEGPGHIMEVVFGGKDLYDLRYRKDIQGQKIPCEPTKKTYDGEWPL